MPQAESRTERLERCLEAVERSPGSAVARYNLGLAWQKLGRFGEAEQAYRKAVELDPTLAEAWVNLGGVRLHGWDFEGCLEASLKAVELRDDLVVAHHNLGQAYLYMNDPENLVRCARRVLELDADHPPSHYYAAVGLLALGELGAAERHLGRAMELGHRPTAEFLRALERAQRSKAEGRIDMVEIGGGEIPGRAKED
ncbi:MAG TPA: tetratricopeptide repeat protein [Thermoanaerobaculales bacterium]|nr:tetratricopeptide repeat protein [Thermoanaerobaculales bacterium]HPA79908.1 tetratricopeptide repeat protein [Thermoanaerobaculales bacterium]HQL31414.1 tetratricopeptide repeat protein [Thermoanaerobaculales bacterium]HQN96986.1 tetratricopeptide repeat protein [Thermoanaerobaculales bacterium]HQP42547.1 tetratricopeptide repeat protein [Thermoanaerobaculales bacterium]